MKAELLKRLFKAIAYGGCYRTIASSDYLAIDKLTHLVIEEECKKGHTLLADQLENITKPAIWEIVDGNCQLPKSLFPPNLLGDILSYYTFFS